MVSVAQSIDHGNVIPIVHGNVVSVHGNVAPIDHENVVSVYLPPNYEERPMVDHGHVIPAGTPDPEDDEVTYTFMAAEEHLTPEQIRQLERRNCHCTGGTW